MFWNVTHAKKNTKANGYLGAEKKRHRFMLKKKKRGRNPSLL
jgi:hypothetical protein